MEHQEEFKQIFFTECAELLADMEERLLKLETGVHDAQQLNAIFRCAHSVKGGAGAFGFAAIMQFTHVLEALLDLMRDGKLLPARETIDALLKSVDIVTRMLVFAKEGKEPPAELGKDIMAALSAHTKNLPSVPQQATPVAPQATGGSFTYEIQFMPHEELFRTGNEPLLVLRALGRLGKMEVETDTARIPPLPELDASKCFIGWNIRLETGVSETEVAEIFEFVQHVSDLKITCVSVTPAAEEKPAAVATKTAEPEQAAKSATTSIRVDLEKVDRLVNMVGELVITEAMLRAQVRHLSADQFPDLLRGVDELSHHTRELQEAVMAVRMQPVKSIFSRMPRIVRDASTQLGKDIQLVLSGENTEVDKTVIEQLGDPLTHMIRNSVDHGIEMPEKRKQSGKSARGTINLSAYHRSGHIIIDISDDGAGINRDRVLQKAREKGLVAADTTPTVEEIDHIVFLPGFSTAEQVTNLSGRGVGMDVVKRNIENMGGTVRITNMPGKGATFTISLPLTLAILDGMIVRVGRENYIVPITSIIETIRPRSEEVRKVEGRSDVINVRGEFVPVLYVSDIFNISNSEGDTGRCLIVLVESSYGRMGLVVDELIGQQQVVIKSLEANSDPVKGISGATILGDGKVSLILEINELQQLCQRHSSMPYVAKAA